MPLPRRPRLEQLEPREVPATFTVTNTNDAGAGSLRAAILAAEDEVTNPGPDTIVFAGAAAGGTIALTTYDTGLNGGPEATSEFGPSAFDTHATFAAKTASGGGSGYTGVGASVFNYTEDGVVAAANNSLFADGANSS